MKTEGEKPVLIFTSSSCKLIGFNFYIVSLFLLSMARFSPSQFSISYLFLFYFVHSLFTFIYFDRKIRINGKMKKLIPLYPWEIHKKYTDYISVKKGHRKD